MNQSRQRQARRTAGRRRRLWGARLALAGLALALLACAGARVVARPAGWSDNVAAACYPADFAGRRTVAGEPYDPQKLTAAHPSLPLNTVVELARDGDDRTTVVRINDRPPLAGPQTVRLSRAAAEQLGLECAGETKLRLTVVKTPPGS